jgi:hypothetical protein
MLVPELVCGLAPCGVAVGDPGFDRADTVGIDIGPLAEAGAAMPRITSAANTDVNVRSLVRSPRREVNNPGRFIVPPQTPQVGGDGRTI